MPIMVCLAPVHKKLLFYFNICHNNFAPFRKLHAARHVPKVASHSYKIQYMVHLHFEEWGTHACT